MTINIIGIITKSIPTDDPDVFDQISLDGWHVISQQLIEGGDDYLLKGDDISSPPYRLFSGVPKEDTHFYVFPDEVTAQSFGIGLPDPVDELV